MKNMTIRKRIISIVVVSIVGLLLFTCVSWFNMNQLSGSVKNIINNSLMPIISDEIPQMNSYTDSIALLLNADRDAYQAFTSEQESINTFDREKLTALNDDNAENMDQVYDRIEKASENFDDKMNRQYSDFKTYFLSWRSLNQAIFKKSLSISESISERKSHFDKSLTMFSGMRGKLDDIVGLVEKKTASAGADAKYNKALGLLLNADRDAYQSFVAEIRLMGETDKETAELLAKEQYENAQQVVDRTKEASKAFDSEMMAIYKDFQKDFADWKQHCSTVATLSLDSLDAMNERNEDAVLCSKAFDAMRGKIDSLGVSLDKMIHDNVDKVNGIGDAAQADSDRLITRIDAVNVFCIGMSLVISFVIVGVSIWIVQNIVKVLDKITDRISMGAEQVATSSGQVSSASQSLAEGATEQAAGLEETSSSLEEMSSKTKQNADNAHQAKELALESQEFAQNGADAMQRMSRAIDDIQNSSDETAKIIKVIDEIAFQTNLLALNAAVEAARAGEAGKGFAVVAEEVRNLAMRSAEAAKNTSAMIQESVNNARNGVEISTEVSEGLDKIVTSIKKTNNLVGDISTASAEQAQGIDQINSSISQMDKVTQNNAANAEESASASQELNSQAEIMKDIVFELATLVGGVKNAMHIKGMANRLSSADKVFHQIASGAAKKQKAAKVSAPAGGIFDDDFSDF